VSFNQPATPGTLKRHLNTITPKTYLAEYKLHTSVRFGESPVPGVQLYDDEISSLIGDDTGWPNRIR
jgi:hypothetical protein